MDSRGNSAKCRLLIQSQLRLTVLERTERGDDDDIEVVFHRNDETSRLANAATRNDPNWVRVADIWNPEVYLQIRKTLDGGNAADRSREARFEKVRRILDYQVPLVCMVDHGFAHAVEAFRRINTLGVRLKNEDIESALVAREHTGFITDEVVPFLKELKDQGFNRLNIMHLFRACAFVATPDGRSRTPWHKLPKRDVLSAWKETKRSTEQAIGLIRSELGLVLEQAKPLPGGANNFGKTRNPL